jgi:hypothetical protein
LKGKVNSDVPVIPEFKEVEKQRKEMEKAARTLEIEAEKAGSKDKKKPFFIRVLTGKRASAKKDFKKLDKDDGKTFSSKIVDSMSKK